MKDGWSFVDVRVLGGLLFIWFSGNKGVNMGRGDGCCYGREVGD